ncbi:sperm mitochondrial-associated cysteine-rich protein-like [Homalodisca vitripennis]|uniref:sperm mitochondrial-associated cysteine-rich protein-like n=1 Tax=Homalodisca vitripennis TaxID=197043 RepID=UPI001EE9D4CF|nr:sperm mitochondrial-associated cysteine-rich protein-like [Homalodisca vitripennis]
MLLTKCLGLFLIAGVFFASSAQGSCCDGGEAVIVPVPHPVPHPVPVPCLPAAPPCYPAVHHAAPCYPAAHHNPCYPAAHHAAPCYPAHTPLYGSSYCPPAHYPAITKKLSCEQKLCSCLKKLIC